VAEQETTVELEAEREFDERGAFGERGATFAEQTFAIVGIKLEERFGQNELEHGVAEEFETLVALRDFRVFRQIRRMRQRALQQRAVTERVAEANLQGGER
jgi:hypothetical protein